MLAIGTGHALDIGAHDCKFRIRDLIDKSMVTSMVRLSASIAVALCITANGSIAWAGETESDTFFARGRELRLKGNCRDAIEEFRRAYEAYPEGLGALRNIAECEEGMNRPASARRSYWALRTAVIQSQSEKYLGWDRDAEKAFKELEPRVAKVVVRVKGSTDPRVTINGRPLTPSLLGTELEQDLGELVVVLEDGSAVPPSKKLVLEAGKRYEVELEPTVSQGTGGPTTPKHHGPSPLVIAGGVTIGVAGLALGGLVGAIVVRQNALATIDEQCPGRENCPESLRDQQERGATASTLVNVFAIGGGVAGAAGLGMLIAGLVTSPKSKPTSEHALHFDLAPAPGGLFMSIGRSF